MTKLSAWRRPKWSSDGVGGIRKTPAGPLSGESPSIGLV